MATITEYYVSFETTKLLKEKGFDEPCNAYWFHMIDAEPIFNDNMPRQVYNNKSDTIEIIGCPTLQMTMKWLEIKKHIAIIPVLSSILDNEKFLWDVKIVIAETGEKYSQGWVYEDRERACEAAIKYYLENLI